MRSFKAVVFDVDGVLTDIDSVWRYIHIKLGTWEKAKQHAKLFYQGEISYEEWAKLDVSLWKNTPCTLLREIVQQIPLKKGIRKLFHFLRNNNLKIFAISAGLDIVIKELILKVVPLDDYISNTLILEKCKVKGEIIIRVKYDNKDSALKELCKKYGISPLSVITVGDSEVDIEMFKVSGFSIAFNPIEEKVFKAAQAVVYGDLNDLLLILRKVIKGH